MTWHNQWSSAADFFAMGGYAFYVWGSFLACAVLMVMEPLLTQARHRKALKDLAREQLADRLSKENPPQ